MKTLEKEDYIRRLVDKKLAEDLKIFGAISIEGPKWCGKTWTGLKHAQSVVYLDDKKSRELASVDPTYIFSDDRPQLIDEWQLSPNIWDAVRHECDMSGKKGNFILTGSTTLEKDIAENAVFHSGAGRISTLKMQPMSLFESGDSSGKITFSQLLKGKIPSGLTGPSPLPEIAQLLVRGGWPANLNVDASKASRIPRSYIETLVTKDIHERKDRRRNSEKMRMLLRSLARNESTVAGDDTLLKDIENYETEDEKLESRNTVIDYLSVLDDLHLTANQPAFSVNYRSSARIGKSPKRHLVDPSLSCALLGLNPGKLMKDLKTFGLLFEAMVERDLRVYMEYLDGKLYHFRDNVSGDEVDAIVEFSDGAYGTIEIKLGQTYVKDGIASLKNFYDNVKRKPKFMCVIVGDSLASYQDPETGVFVVPITSLGV